MIIGSLISVAWDTQGNIFTDALGRLWKRADGSALNISDYPELFGIIGTRYGSNTASDFKLPNFTSRFLRGWDPTSLLDVDSTSRTIPGPGLTSADAGTVQPEIIRTHQHTGFTGRFFTTAVPGVYVSNSASGQYFGVGPNFTTTRSGVAISGYPTVTNTFTPDSVLPYHMVVDFLVRIK
jgi:microcystin-dependent protein